MSIKTIIQNGAVYDYKENHFVGETKREKFLQYKNSNKRIDFDSIEPVVETYRQAYEFLNEYKLKSKGGKNFNIIKDNLIYTGETMNSGLNILKKSMQFSTGYLDYCKKMGVSGGFSDSKNIKVFSETVDKFRIEVSNERLDEFLGLTHSIGNFIPVPQGFNVGRNLPTSDYWDLALYNIHLWYKTKNDNLLNRFLLKKNSSVIENTKVWLNYFNSWPDFIHANYLQPFVDTEFMPKSFWDNHFDRYERYHSENSKVTKKKAVEPQNIAEVDQFLTKVNRMIIERGELIITALLNKEA